jgi:UDP-glucose 4-epimerase
MKKILVTGGTGYIGSHTCVALCEAGYTPVVLDAPDLHNLDVLQNMEQLTNQPIAFELCDPQDVKSLRDVLTRHQPDAVIHLSGDELLRASGHLNALRPGKELLDRFIWSGACLIQAMEDMGCRRLLVASSETVYRHPHFARLQESSPQATDHPVGGLFQAMEELYATVQRAGIDWKIGVLRLFDVVGAHRSGLLGAPLFSGSTDWLMEMAHVAQGLLPHAGLQSFDQNTDDGTPVRDYIHVADVADAMVAALHTVETYHEGFVVNVGSGEGRSRLEALLAFEKAVDRTLAFRPVGVQIGEAPYSLADITFTTQLLGWRPRRPFAAMCADTLGWHDACLQGLMPERRPAAAQASTGT